MELLEALDVTYGAKTRTIGVYHGDLAHIPASEAVDLLVVSAFPNDYTPTPGSLVGALYAAGVSVEGLAQAKADDLRDAYGCWLSHALPTEPSSGFRRLLCFEPAFRGRPPEVVGDIFRCLMPIVQGEIPVASLAMPLVASGDMDVPREMMLQPLLEAAVHWLEAGLPIETIKIVDHDRETAEHLARALREFGASRSDGTVLPRDGESDYVHDVFLSYSRADQGAADLLDEALRAHPSRPRVFKDLLEIDVGASWQQAIWQAMESCRRVVALYSPTYLESKVCQEEYAIARLRHREEKKVLVPVYLRTAALPVYVRILNYIDCRESDPDRLRAALKEMV